MNKTVYIVHGWDSHSQDAWLPWLAEELKNLGVEVIALEMPEPRFPRIEAWVEKLKNEVKDVDENVFFVGHSVGCQAIIRYLEGLDVDKKIGGAIFVGGWFHLQNVDGKEEIEIARPWLETPVNFEKVKIHCERFVALFSDNDFFVPLSEVAYFEDKLGAKTIVLKKQGHFDRANNVTKVDELLQESAIMLNIDVD